ncbi:MAG: sulfatase [Planctomycetota bacterium]
MAKPKRQNSRRQRRAPVAAALLVVVGATLLGAGAWWWLSGPGSATTEGGDQAAAGAASLSSNQPTANVVIFLIDTLRADRLGAYGYPKATSPQMDALATRGVVFEQCHAAAPWTLPSVASLLTSTFPCEHGVLLDRQKIGEALEPLAERLKRAGYATASFYANGYAGPMTGLDRGYDKCQRSSATDGTLVGEWLDSLGDQPFFVYIHNIEPHNPYNAPDRLVRHFGKVSVETKKAVWQHYLQYRKLTRADYDAKWPIGTSDNTAEQDRVMQQIAELQEEVNVLYDAAIRQADEHVGSVVRALRQRGLLRETLFMILSDHGEELADHGGWQHDQSVYEELVRVPLIVRFPEARFAGRRISEVVTLVDVLPTILDYLGRGDLASGSRGRSLIPLIHGESLVGPDELVGTSMRINRKKYYRPYQETRGDVNLVVRQANWKGIWNLEIPSLELYDLSGDPGERSNLAEDQPDLAAAMQQRAQAWFEACELAAAQPTPADREEMDEEDLESLRSLGYVE